MPASTRRRQRLAVSPESQQETALLPPLPQDDAGNTTSASPSLSIRHILLLLLSSAVMLGYLGLRLTSSSHSHHPAAAIPNPAEAPEAPVATPLPNPQPPSHRHSDLCELTLRAHRHGLPRTFYGMLAIPRDATADEIRAAFLSRVQAVHCDGRRQSGCEHRSLLCRVYAVVRDEGRRREYDSFLRAVEERPEGGWEWRLGEICGHESVSKTAAETP